jgi:hypothetical protein
MDNTLVILLDHNIMREEEIFNSKVKYKFKHNRKVKQTLIILPRNKNKLEVKSILILEFNKSKLLEMQRVILKLNKLQGIEVLLTKQHLQIMIVWLLNK